VSARSRVTIVMTARERYSLTEAALDSIVADTSPPYRLVYLDAQTPRWLTDILAERAAEWNLEVVHYDEPLWPQEARARFAASIDTDYAVFIDNDVEVEEGWLDALVRCADETGAGIVGPLYLWGDGLHAPKIHMAGGRLIEAPAEGGRVLDESHRLFNADPRLVRNELVRQPCDFVEFHCMFVRTTLLREPGFFDPSIRCVHEHIDVALQCVQRGHPVYFEPASRVRYLAFVDYMLDDLPFFRQRWSIAEGEASIAAFARKWNVVNDDRSFGGVRSFLASHVTHADPLLPDVAGVDRRAPMLHSQLARERSSLLYLALARDYARDDVVEIARTYDIAQRLLDRAWRPCGRPFINHVVGTAAVLIHYGFDARVVTAALVHAAYTHVGFHADSPETAAAAIDAALGGEGSALQRRAREYADRDAMFSSEGTADDLATL